MLISNHEQRIRELCARAVDADSDHLAEVIEELRSALRQHTQQMRNLARAQFPAIKTPKHSNI